MKLKKLLKEIEVLGQEKPIPLSKVDPAVAKIAISSGRKDNDQVDDIAMTKKASIAVKNLKPAQTEIIKEKAFALAIKFLSKDDWDNVDLEAIISNDNYIMDGHHRWAAVSLISKNAKIVGTVVNLPGQALVSVLNVVTKALGRKGNVGKGDIKTFTGSQLEPIIDKALQEGFKGDFPVTPEQIKAAMIKMPGADGDVEKAKQLMMANADALPKKIMPNAPARIDMPVIGPEEVNKVTVAIKNGVVDFTAPYSPGVQSNLQESVTALLNKAIKKQK